MSVDPRFFRIVDGIRAVDLATRLRVRRSAVVKQTTLSPG